MPRATREIVPAWLLYAGGYGRVPARAEAPTRSRRVSPRSPSLMHTHGSLLSWEDAVSWLRSQPDKAQLVLECYYDDPPLAAARRYYASGEWQAVRALLGTMRGRALDVGAGRGIASYALARDGFEVTALEPDPSELIGAGAIRALA